MDSIPHPKFPFGREEYAATGEQRLDMRHFEMHGPHPHLLSTTRLHCLSAYYRLRLLF